MPGAVLRRALAVALGAWLLAWQVGLVLGAGLDGNLLFSRFGHDVVLLAAAGLTLWAGFASQTPAERRAWLWIGSGVTAWTLGEIYYTAILWTADEIPIPSPADAGYLLFPPCALIGTAFLLRSRLPSMHPIMWIDGLIAALGSAAVGAELAFDRIRDAVSGQALEVALGLAYPLMDLVLLGVVVGALAATGWRLEPAWLLLALGIGAFCIADALYLVANAESSYTPGSWFDIGWWLGMVLIAAAAWRPRVQVPVAQTQESLRRIVMPLVFGLAGLGVLLTTDVVANLLAIVLAVASLLALMVRALLTFRENVTMLRASREEAHTDPLTGLRNRRALTRDLRHAVAGAADARPVVLALFDLNGFKHYNDTFGHPAGDALLARLGASLSHRVDGHGRAYRMGGDEFCALIQPGREPAELIVRAAVEALAEHGEGFAISCAFGWVAVPQEATEPNEALRIADQRMYAHKAAGRTSAVRESTDVLLRALAERSPALGDHTTGVAALAEATARRLGLPADQVGDVRHAAELHDVGKVGVPDAILAKPGPLDPAEWAFIRRHTVIGERIIVAAPSLSRVAPLVRSSHERWDGTGYPDALAEHAIPLGARIVAVADAFEAMTAQRPYGVARTPAEALAELRRCSGTQFDPVVVEAFCAVLDDRPAPLAIAA